MFQKKDINKKTQLLFKIVVFSQTKERTLVDPGSNVLIKFLKLGALKIF